jgi:hypothetical protein
MLLSQKSPRKSTPSQENLQSQPQRVFPPTLKVNPEDNKGCVRNLSDAMEKGSPRSKSRIKERSYKSFEEDRIKSRKVDCILREINQIKKRKPLTFKEQDN